MDTLSRCFTAAGLFLYIFSEIQYNNKKAMKDGITMRKKLIILITLCILLSAMLLFAFRLDAEQPEPSGTTAATYPTQPAVSTDVSTQAPTEPPTEFPTEPPTEPQPTEYMLSFAGDCCLANLKGWSESGYFIGTVGDDYAYPFANVQEYFASDDCTFINLECALTNSTASASKQFVFKGPTEYTKILTVGNVEFANVVNNHSKDYGQTGYDDTLAALDSVGLLYVEQRDTKVFTTDSGLTIGVYADLYPEDIDGLEEKISAMRSDGAEIVIVIMHWGVEYYYQPNATQTKLGHAAIDAGADIVYGTHPHVLQPVEEYNGGMIYYSLGNFSFGGHTNPPDKDSAILRQAIIREPDGSVHLGDLTMIPCSLSSVSNTNDFQPTPLEPNTENYQRVLAKLTGTYDKTKISVSSRPELG